MGGKFHIIFLSIFFVARLYSQDANSEFSDLNFNPGLTEYNISDFKSSEQFYGMEIDDNGILYFGNNDGVLVFDGERWQKVLLPNNSHVTSLVKSEAGDIYAGGFNEFGVVKRNTFGTFEFQSLKEKYNMGESNFDYLWQAHTFKEYILFRSFGELILLSSKGITHIKPKNFFVYSGVINGEFYAMDYDHGLMKFDSEKLGLVEFLSAANNDFNGITSFLPSSEADHFYLATKAGRIYSVNERDGSYNLWTSLFQNEIEELTTAVKFGKNYILGTDQSEILVLTQEGVLTRNHKAFSEISNATFVNFFVSDKTFWILKNNGISALEFDLPDIQLFDKSSVYDILIDKDKIYLGTSSGVFFSEFKIPLNTFDNLKFSKMPGLDGQVWSIDKIDQNIFVSGHNGLYRLKKDKLEILYGKDSFWKVIKVKSRPDILLASSYNGLYLLNLIDNQWEVTTKVQGFDESSRDILADNAKNTFWVCHGYKGVFKLKLEDNFDRVYSLEHFTDKNGLDSPFNINVTHYDNRIVFTTNTGIFQFDEKAQHFESYEPLNKILGREYNTTSIEKGRDRTWFVQNDQFGFFDNTKSNPKLQTSLFLNLKGKLNRSMESYLPLEKDKILIGANDGLYFYKIDSQAGDKVYHTVLTKVSYYSGDDKKWMNEKLDTASLFPGKIDVLRFEFATPGMALSVKREYQYKLNGIDSEWSDWTENNFKEYTYLGPGTYDFKVRSRNMNGQFGNEASSVFEVPESWYETNLFRISVFLIIAMVLITTFQIGQKRIRKQVQKEKDLSERSKRLLELEIEQLKLKQESQEIELAKNKLEEDLIAQQKELANYTMLLVKKKEILVDIYEDLKEFSQKLKNTVNRKTILGILSKIRQHRIGEEYMEVFDVNFERVHVDFFNKLLELNPELTKRELRLCAFVKLDLTNKEIAPLLNISVRGVETGRYRVRKKLKVQEKNFKVYLDGLSSELNEKTPV
ncbi:helix-turn-helix and ligand-binding sensor domain-containing protein [Lutimonas zeaxanthinifaciens]|uniref:helix-turn-helix and ligand-binding sensor domain-containing protein n=1 Tax=Lutimonas zeaxanthinifaciens TaxID=3060215 RepID=UPI00265CDB44|nr:triple tyrosine motif-containing protein [Lutimonas sp. YSD2104]WKK65668.1 triple tyrosine motif-containing protein [Lutimonas sp. YSD2104]